MRKLPSIKLLVTFEAAARHLSFKEAAKELFVTPSAVSHQVRVLEQALNTALFKRSNRSIELTQEGRRYFEEISQAIGTIYTATESLMAQSEDKTLCIHCIPYLTNAFIVPNIKSFKTQYPNVKISIESRVERAQLNEPYRQDLQVGLRHGKVEDDEFEYEEICPITISPICSVDYSLEQNLTQLQLSTDSESWEKWQTDWDMKLEFADTLSCDSAQAVVDMVGQGLGIAMGYLPLINPKLDRGELALAYPDKVSRLDSLYLAYPKKDRDDPIIPALLSWLKATIKP